jgi:hypothetical protein
VTTTTTARYRAQTDPSIKTWHLGTEELGARCVCGCTLMTPDDTRAFALKVPAGKRDYQTDPDVAKVTCGSCKRNREYAKATAADVAAPSRTVAEAATARPSRRRKATGDPRADRAAADAGQVSGSGVIEADPETGLPRIKPEYAAKAERVAAAQIAAARAARDAANADQA